MFRQTNAENQQEILDTIDTLSSPLGDNLMTMAEFLEQSGAKKRDIQLVINCLKEGAKIDFISKVTGLSKKEINKIAAEHKLH